LQHQYKDILTAIRNLNILSRDTVGSVCDRKASCLQSRSIKIYLHKLREKCEKQQSEIDAEDPFRSGADSPI